MVLQSVQEQISYHRFLPLITQQAWILSTFHFESAAVSDPSPGPKGGKADAEIGLG